LHIFGKRQSANCAVCGKELGRHRYKPGEGWGIDGLLCGSCHVEKTKEFMIKQEETPDKCAMCGQVIEGGEKPKWQWEMEPGSLLCKACFQKKDADHNKKTNFCASCGGKLGMFFYHPKPVWQIQGNLCRKCWDVRRDRE
jgi:hypothetical protein